MKIFNGILNKKGIFLIILVVILIGLIFFVKSDRFLEINNKENIIAKESIENPDTNNDSREEFYPIDPKERTPGLPYDDLEPQTPSVSRTNNDLVYRYDGVMSMRFGECFELHDGSELKTSEKESRMQGKNNNIRVARN